MKNTKDTNAAIDKQKQQRSTMRSQQKSKTETGRSSTILTDPLSESAGDIAGTVGGKSLLGL